MNSRTLVWILAFGFSASCAQADQAIELPALLPALNESGFELMHPVSNLSSNLALKASTQFVLDQPTTLRFNKANILEFVVEVPAGTEIQVPNDYQVVTDDYRKSDGTVERSSTGFMTPVTIISVPADQTGNFPAAKIAQYNATAGGLFITAAVVGEMQGLSGDFDVLHAGPAGAGFNANYQASGKPKFNYSNSLKKRFGSHVNRAVDPASQSPADRAKWNHIFNEIVRASNRTVATAKSIVMIDKDLAVKESIDFEKTGTIPLNGAWTIATQATAVRHGFSNVPCAETVSEYVREAYERAGYRVEDDFNDVKKNRLIWSETAAVVNLTAALDKAGWVPWDTTVYRPPTGALMMDGTGKTPGHAYIAAGDDGRMIVDNGAPQGRDLRTTSQKVIEMMYQTGVFFLPPGINPQKW